MACADHQPAHLLLERVILFFKLVVLLLDSEVVLDFLSLVVVANLHLLIAHLLKFSLQPFLLVSECLERQDKLLDLVFSLLEHLFLLPVVRVETLALTASVLLIASRVLDLAILDLDELSQILILFLERLVLGRDGLLLLLGLSHACLVLLVLLTQLRDFALQVSQELVLFADHVGDGLLRRHQQVRLLARLRLVLQQFVLSLSPLLV